MRKVMVIVARDRPDLYEYFKEGLEGVDGVEVILDRRVHLGGSRGPSDAERRDLQVHEELALRGFIIRPTGAGR